MSALDLLLLLASVAPQDAPGPGVSTAAVCATCHSAAPEATAMRDSTGASIAPYDLWRSTMMANAARDPLWRAVVSAEIAATPSRQREIEETCLRCHSPLAERSGLEDHDTGSFLHLLDCKGEKAELALDGVSCTICHGIRPDNLGTPESFSAGFELDEQRRLFGPHDTPFINPMRMHSGFTPARGDHITESRLCGSCHTLETHAFTPDGERDESPFLEQSPYLEWRNSVWEDESDTPGPMARSCQDCHVPTRDAAGVPNETRIARNPMGRDFPPVKERSPFGRHLFVGGNTLILSILRDHREELRVDAPAAAFDATIAAARDQLQHRTATLALADATREDGRLRFALDVQNLTGHKLPTGHPTRRAWLRVVIRDAGGNAVFASGQPDDQGRVLGPDGAPLASELPGGPVPPHRDVITAADQVATYEAIMADASGSPTFTLLRGARWYVDDRLLPAGWTADHPEAVRTAPIGVEGDASFRGGADRVRFDLDLAGQTGELTIEAALLYQSLSARWAAELLQVDTPEVKRFARMYAAADRAPEVLAEATATVR